MSSGRFKLDRTGVGVTQHLYNKVKLTGWLLATQTGRHLLPFCNVFSAAGIQPVTYGAGLVLTSQL